MKTILLPGFSIQNKDWSEEIKREIGGKIGLEIHYWPHWQTGKTVENWKEIEVEKFLEEMKDEIANIISKSIGTLVAVMTINKKPEAVNKIILCGIPLSALKEEDKEKYKILAKLPFKNVLVIQNEKDNTGSFEDVKKMMEKINPNIRVISKPREDHAYPYPEEFEEFLRQDTA